MSSKLFKTILIITFATFISPKNAFSVDCYLHDTKNECNKDGECKWYEANNTDHCHIDQMRMGINRVDNPCADATKEVCERIGGCKWGKNDRSYCDEKKRDPIN